MSILVYSFNTQMDIHSSDLIFLTVAPLCSSHPSALYIESDLINLLLILQNVQRT
jgi:hypothetical protein